MSILRKAAEIDWARVWRDVARKANLQARRGGDYRCSWPKCNNDRTGVLMGWGLCDRCDQRLSKVYDSIPEVVALHKRCAAKAAEEEARCRDVTPCRGGFLARAKEQRSPNS